MILAIFKNIFSKELLNFCILFYVPLGFLLKLCNKIYMSNILGLKFIDIDTLVRGGRGVFSGKRKIKFSFSTPFINLLFCFMSSLV